MSKKKWRKKTNSEQKVNPKPNPLENIDTNDEGQLREGLKYLTNLIEKKVSLQQMAAIKDSDINAIIATGVLLYQQGRYKEAEDILRGALLLNNNSALAHSALGTILTAEGKHDEALIHLSEAITLDSLDIAAYVNRGEIYLKQADFKAASEDLRKAVELDPNQCDPAANRARAIIVGINEMVKELQNQIDQGQEPEI